MSEPGAGRILPALSLALTSCGGEPVVPYDVVLRQVARTLLQYGILLIINITKYCTKKSPQDPAAGAPCVRNTEEEKRSKEFKNILTTEQTGIQDVCEITEKDKCTF